MVMDVWDTFSAERITNMCEPKYKRYITMGLRDGELHRILSRRGYTPDGIINRTLELTKPRHFLTDVANRRRQFDKLYLMEVGGEGTYGNTTNLKLLEIKPPPPPQTWGLWPVKSAF